MNLIDLHAHTTCSDGTFTPTELIEYAAEKNLKAIAITDHDTICAIEEAAPLAAKYGIELIPGVEISAFYNEVEIHVLGLFIDIKNPEFLNMLNHYLSMRHERNLQVIKLMNKENIPITLEDLQTLSGGEITGRSHFAQYLVANGYASSIKEAFGNYLIRGRKTFVSRVLPDYKETLEIIRKAGGIPVLAHPVSYRLDYETCEAMIKELKADGLMGLEAIYSTNTPEDDAAYQAIANKYSLIITGGSDFHGDNKPGLDLGSGYGNLAIDYSILENLKRFRPAR